MTRNPMLARSLALLMTAALSFPASAAFADPQRAAEYYDQASEAYQSGDLRTAADLLDQAFAEDPDLVYKYNRILALQGLGDYENALAELKALYAPMKADPEARFDDIDQIKAQLESSIAAREADQAPDTEAGETATESDVTLGEEASAPKKSNVPAYALLGGGALAVGVGVLFGTGQLMPAAARQCVGVPPGPQQCDDYAREKQLTESDARAKADDVRTVHVITAISLYSVGAVLGAVGLVLLLSDGGSADASSTSTGLDSLQVAPMIGANAGGAMLQLRF